jgi:hypothetical protein
MAARLTDSGQKGLNFGVPIALIPRNAGTRKAMKNSKNLS